MNVLYIGPHKYNNFLGLVSRDIVSSLLNTEDVILSTRHIFVNNPYENATMVSFKANDSQPLLQNYDCVIQHCPPQMMYVDRSIAKKYIAIPIMDYTVDASQQSVLKTFDTVCVDSVAHQKNLKKLDIESTLINYSIKAIKNNNRLNLGINKFTTKLYFIGSYQNNANIINKLIISFILAFRDKQDISLILILNDSERDKVLSIVDKNISDIYKKLNYNTKLSQIQIMVQSLSEETVQILHKDLDIYIDISEEYETGLNYHIARQYGNFIITMDDVDSVFVPCLDDVQHDTRYRYSALTSSIIDTMKNTVKQLDDKKSPIYKDSKNIIELL
jgi:hypothetical protein